MEWVHTIMYNKSNSIERIQLEMRHLKNNICPISSTFPYFLIPEGVGMTNDRLAVCPEKFILTE